MDAETCYHKSLAIGTLAAECRMDAIEHYDAVEGFISVDVGKGEHHAVALSRADKRSFDKALPNEEARLRTLISGLKEYGKLLLVDDQPTTIGALPVTIARAEGILVAYLPAFAMRRIADLHPADPRPTRGTPQSSPRPHAQCRMGCDHFVATTNSYRN